MILAISHLLFCNKFRYNSRPNEKKSLEKKMLILLKDFFFKNPLVALILSKQSKKLILKF